jgi:hypothetical protein
VASLHGLRQCTAWASALGLLCITPLVVSAGELDGRPFKLLFSGKRDLFNAWGQLQISVTPIDSITRQPPSSPDHELPRPQPTQPERRVVGAFPLANGVWKVYSQEFTKLTTTWPAVSRWKLLRSTTTDGLTFRDTETVIAETTGRWTSHLAMAYNPDADEYLMLKIKMDPRGEPPNDSNGFAYHAWFSSDGRRWNKYAGTRRDGALFYEGDAMTVLWSPSLRRFVLVSKSLQPWQKRISDHGRNRRRVLMIRTSPNGRHWTPEGDLTNIYGRNPPGPTDSHPAEWYTAPDAQDPPDLEFYSGNAFWYHDRAYMMVLNYAASRMYPGAHGEELDNEWWTSYDGLNWERPARGVNALSVFRMGLKRFEMGPIVVDGNLIWLQQGQAYGLLEDRISGVSARANGEFSTRLFTMPDGDLLLNVAVPSPDRSWLRRTPQPYVMVEVVNAQGAVIPGYERTKCVIWDQSDGLNRNLQVDATRLRLLWNGVSARRLSGQLIRLRFYFSGSTIYAVTSNAKPSNTIARSRSTAHVNAHDQTVPLSANRNAPGQRRSGDRCQVITQARSS